MSNEVDLRELAIDRGAAVKHSVRSPRHMLTRYLLPALLILGFLSLVAWASRDLVFPPKPVTVVPVFSTSAETMQEGTPLFKAAGWIEPRPTPIRVAALAPGVVEKLLVVEDQALTKGEAIAQLVTDDARFAHQRSLADLELRKAELDEAMAAFTAAETRLKQPVHLEAALNEAQAALAKVDTQLQTLPFQVRRAEADHAAMKRDYEGKVAAKGVVAGNQIDIAESKAEAARATLEELRDRFNSLEREQQALAGRRDALKTQLELLADEKKARDEAGARIKAAKARVARAEVLVSEAKLRLDRMSIAAPIDGRVFRLIAHPGARLGSGMTQLPGHDGSTVITMYRPSMLQVRVDVRFEDIPKVSLGQPVEIDNPALQSPLNGKVLFISSEADIQKNTLQVKVEIPVPPNVFKPEMLVDATFMAPQQKPAPRESAEPKQVRLYVLQQLIQSDQTGPFVWLADQSEGVARKAAITTGPVGSNGLVQITSGLNMASRIIASGSDSLRDGERITVIGEDRELGMKELHRSGGDSQRTSRLPNGGNE